MGEEGPVEEQDRARVESTLREVRGHAATVAELEGAVVTRWVVVMEHMSVDGQRWLSTIGSEGLTVWDRRGMLGEVVDGEWD